MADYIVKDTELTSVANAIRTAGGTSSLLSFPNGFVSAVNNISGGGGSSDFSTAQVTVTNNVETTLYAPYVVDVDGLKGIFIATSNSGEFDVALYKGMCQAGFFSPTPPTFNVVVTGDITYNEGTFSITGDGTITIS